MRLSVLTFFTPLKSVIPGLLLGWAVPVFAEAPTAPALTLTTAEKAWLAAHPVIRLGVDPDFAPYAFIDAQGRPAGVAAEFTERVAERLGVRMEHVPGLTWPQILQAARDREIDVITTATFRPERLEYLKFTYPYLITPLVVMTRDETPILRDLDQLNRMNVALVREYSSTRFALERFPGIDALLVANPLEGLQAVSDRRAEAYIGVLGINTYLASRHGISNLKVNAGFDMANSQRYGVRKDWPELVPLLEKALNSIPAAEQQKIFARWISVSVESIAAPAELLDAQARARIAALPELRVGVLQGRVPFDFVDKDGVHTGLSADVLKLLVLRTGLKTETVPEAKMERLRERLAAGDLDLVLAVNGAAPGAPARALSDPYFVSALGVFARTGGVFLGEVSHLLDQRVAVHAGAYAEEILRAHPRIALQAYPSLTAAAHALLEGKADYLVAETTSALRAIEQSGIAGLRYAGTLAQTPVTLSLAVSPHRADLLPLLNRALATITPSDAAEIRRRWVATPLETDLGWRRLAGAGALVFVATIMLMGIWRYQSTTRAYRALKASQAERDQTEIRRRTIFETASVSLWEEDITEVRRLIELHRAEVVAGWEEYFDAHPSLVTDCVRALKVLDVNAATLRLYEATSKSELLTSIERVFTDESYQVFHKELAAIAEGRRSFTAEATTRTLHGKEINVLASISIPPADSPVQRMVVAVLDITEHKRAEKERGRLFQKLEERNREMESFVYTISHDLKTPLITIGGFANLLAKDFERGDKERGRESIGEIRKAADGMQQLIEDLLLLSRTGQIEGIPEDVDLSDLLKEIQARCARLIERERATLRVASPLPRLHVDRARFGQVFQNLIDNGVKFHRDGVDPVLEIGAKTIAGEIRLFVRDNGIGIEKRHQEKIFGLFQRLDTQREGTGVGLTIARRIVEQHGGRLTVESEPGQGSVFWISLPGSVMVKPLDARASGETPWKTE